MVKPQQLTVEKGGPTLGTIRMVEQTLRNAPNSLTTLAELKQLLPKQVNHHALLDILDHLQEYGRILVSVRGIAYTHNTSTHLDAAIRAGRVVAVGHRRNISAKEL